MVIPLACVAGFILLICAIVFGCILIKKCQKEREKAQRDKLNQAQAEKNKLQQQQKEEASRLEKLQKEQEKNMQNQLYMNQTNYTNNTQYQPGNNQFIMPGTAVQPTYQVVNPYAGNHNYSPVPVVYDPSTYGVQYDQNTQIQAPQQTPKQVEYNGNNPNVTHGQLNPNQVHPFSSDDSKTKVT